MRRILLLTVVALAVLTSVAHADRASLLRIPIEDTQVGQAMQPSSELPTPELVGFSPADLGRPTILELDHGSASIKVIWRDSRGQIVKRPGDYNVFAFSEQGVKNVQLAMRNDDVLRLTPKARGSEWLTVVVRLRDLPVSWAKSAWVSWADFSRISSRQDQRQSTESSVSNENTWQRVQLPNQTMNNASANASAVSNQAGVAVNAP